MFHTKPSFFDCPYLSHCKDTNPCTSLPCLNDGICTPIDVDSFECNCPDGFTGDTCTEIITTTTRPVFVSHH